MMIMIQAVTTNLLYVPICVIKEIYRAKKTLGGIADGKKVFADNELLQVLLAKDRTKKKDFSIFYYFPRFLNVIIVPRFLSA